MGECDDGRRDVLDFFNKGEVGDECIEIGSVGSDIGEEVQRFMLKFVELVASNSEEGVEEETGGWGRDILVEERRRRGRYLPGESVVDSGGRGVKVGLVG